MLIELCAVVAYLYKLPGKCVLFSACSTGPWYQLPYIYIYSEILSFLGYRTTSVQLRRQYVDTENRLDIKLSRRHSESISVKDSEIHRCSSAAQAGPSVSNQLQPAARRTQEKRDLNCRLVGHQIISQYVTAE